MPHLGYMHYYYFRPFNGTSNSPASHSYYGSGSQIWRSTPGPLNPNKAAALLVYLYSDGPSWLEKHSYYCLRNGLCSCPNVSHVLPSKIKNCNNKNDDLENIHDQCAYELLVLLTPTLPLHIAVHFAASCIGMPSAVVSFISCLCKMFHKISFFK